jgi:6-phosphofructokinase 2
MPKVVTLTMNPAIDVSTAVDRIEPVGKLRCASDSRDPGGGGINVARVVSRLGGSVLALYPAGGALGGLLQDLLKREGVHSSVTHIDGETREDFTVLERASDQQFRFVLPGPRLHDREWMACLKALAMLPIRPDIVCASGSLPPGVPEDFYSRVAEIAAGFGAKFVLDAAGAPLKKALSSHIHLIKPNQQEMLELAGSALDDDASLLAACQRLIEGGRVEAVALTLGARGALLVTAEGAWRARPPPVEAISAVGAGDSFLGAMVWAMGEGRSLCDAFRHGAAGGAAAVLASGTELCQAHDVLRLAGQVTVDGLTEAASV